jgi:hypothetical protein
MNRYFSIICIILAILAALGIFAYVFLETYDREVRTSPSVEVRSNDFAALERWLSASGHPANTLQFTDAESILQTDEDVLVINSSSLNWEEDTFDVLSPWIENGKHLFVYHNYYQNSFYDEDFYSFVNQFDVKIITPDDDEYFIKDEIPETQEAEPHVPTSDDAEIFSADKEEDFLAIDQTIQFAIEEDQSNILFAGAFDGAINLVHIPVGKGSVTFTGSPFFMQNFNINRGRNKFLAWELTGAKDSNKKGILFVQEIEFQNTFFQDLINEGTIFPLIISILVLIVICFWRFIPRFGKIIADEEISGKPIRERFLAEAVFLKKFRSLSKYIDVYENAIQQRFRKNYGEYIDDEKIFCTRLAEIVKIDAAIIEQSLYPKKIITSRSFVKHMKTIEIIMERL